MPTPSSAKQWLHYWRNSLADADGGKGALQQDDLQQARELATEIFQQGHFPSDHAVLHHLFQNESEEKQYVRVALRPAVYRTGHHHGHKQHVRTAAIIAPILCIVWVTRSGLLIPAETPVIPRDLLAPQADDQYTLSTVEAHDKFLDGHDATVYSEVELAGLAQDISQETHGKLWDEYLAVSRQLFGQLVDNSYLRQYYTHDNHASLLKLGSTVKGAAQHLLKLYDWLAAAVDTPTLLDTYTLKSPPQTRALCVDALARLDHRLGHPHTQYPLAEAQRDALAQVMTMADGELLAVNGPPGTGKTAFVLSVVASLWVKAALAENEPPLVVAASTNNQAVTNILDAFARDFEEDDTPLGGRWLPDITSYGGFYAAKSRMKGVENRYQTPSFYHQYEHPEQIERAEQFFLNRARIALEDDNLATVATIRAHLHDQLAQCHVRLCKIQDLCQQRHEVDTQLAAYTPDKLTGLKDQVAALRQPLRDVENDLQQWQQFCARESIWLSLLSFLPPMARKRRLQRELFIQADLSQSGRGVIQQADPGRNIETGLKDWIDRQKAKIAPHQQALDTYQTLLDRRTTLDAELTPLLPDPACTTRESIDSSLDTTLRFQLFRWAVHYWEARWLEDCHAQAKDLAKQARKSMHKQSMGLTTVRPRWRRRMKLTPCIVSTLHSLPSYMGYSIYEGPGQYSHPYLIGEVDLLIMDEAGQIAPDIAAANCALAKRALAIGDVHQIQPVSKQSGAVDIGNLKSCGLISRLTDYDTIRDSGRSVTDGSVMKIAQQASRCHYLAKAEPGMFLREHRRCLQPIIDYSNQLCYQGLLVPKRGTPAKMPALPPFAYVHVDGHCARPPSGSRHNPVEADTIAAWIASQRKQIEACHDQPIEKVIGVVTPFKAQAERIAQACQDRGINIDGDDNAMTIGTVHALQGAERPIVIFSAVYTRHADGPFIDQTPSMLNVAVSRAKDSFVVFGDMDVIDNAEYGSPRHLLGRYLLAHDDNALPFGAHARREDLQTQEGQPRLITNAEEHDKWLRELLPTLHSRIVLVSPWVSLHRMQETGLLTSLEQARKQGMQIVIYTDRRFNTCTNNQADAEKTRQFQTCCQTLNTLDIVIKIVKGVHSKMVMADDNILCVGSFNWGSAVREGRYKNMETSMVYQGNLQQEIQLQIDFLEQRSEASEPTSTENTFTARPEYQSA